MNAATYVMRQMSRAKPLNVNVKHDTNICKCPPVISLFSFLHTGTVFMQFRGRLVRQYRACVIDSLRLGITCVLYHCTMCTRHPDLVSCAFYAIPIQWNSSKADTIGTWEFVLYREVSLTQGLGQKQWM